MSIITNGEAGGSLTSGNTSTNTNNGREDHHHDHGVIVEKQEFIPDQHQNFHIDSVNSLSSTTTLSNGSTTQLPLPIKKKRNPPGNPDPSAEVVALSPNTLVTKNRFVCEICSKGFQRDQNLQLHRRGHNLPWKLRQRNANEVVRKRVYVCPEASCVHHNPARALGDLTGIKKHFSRKHGDKKWKCDRCSKKYAVHSDWKAHSKTCGTREYKCECGTIFSRRDSFITHRAFCDAIAEENSKTTMLGQMSSVERHPNLATQISNRAELISSLMNNNNNNIPFPPLPPTNDNIIINDKCYTTSPRDHHHQTPQDLITSTTTTAQNPLMINNNLKNPLAAQDHHHHDHERGSTIITTHNGQQCQNGTTIGTCHYMSATALLQKAAQMGSTASAGAGSGGVNNGSVMAPPSYGLAHHDQYGHHGLMMINVNNKNINGNSGSNDNHNNNNNNVGFFGGLLFGHHHHHHGHAGQNDVVLHGGNSATTGGDVMTVDFLGIGRSQKQVVNNNLQGSNNQQSKGFDDDDDQVLMFDGHDESDNLQGLSHFEQHAEIIGKQFWEV